MMNCEFLTSAILILIVIEYKIVVFLLKNDVNVVTCCYYCSKDEMNAWMSKVNAASGTSGEQSTSPARASTLPTSVESPRSEEPKKRGFFTLGKKKYGKSSRIFFSSTYSDVM